MSSSGIATSLLNLPSEIWLRVFLHLPYDDRKRFILTCRRFYLITNCARVQEAEQTAFYGNINSNAALELFSNCERKVWNIKFNRVSLLDNSILLFFHRHGINVRSLALENCKISLLLFKDIIEYCEDLRSFTLSFDCHFYTESEWNCLDSFDVFKALKNDGIIRQSVTSFALKLDNSKWMRKHPLTNEKFPHIFTVFPNIKDLDLDLAEYHFRLNVNQNSPAMTSAAKFSLACISHQVCKMRDQLRRLSLFLPFPYYGPNALNHPTLEMFNKILHTEMKNLEELSSRWNTLWDDSVINSITQLEHLTHLECCIGRTGIQPVSHSMMIELILNAATKLHSLSIQFETPTFTINRNCFQLLVRSQLKTFSICSTKTYVENHLAYGDVEINFQHSGLENSLRPNHSLKYFHLTSPNSSAFKLLCASYFHSLKSLEVSFGISILQAILRYQKNLHHLTLHIHSSQSSSVVQQFREEIQCRQFDHLTHLCLLIDENRQSLSLSEIFLSEFVFPKLKSLILVIECVEGVNEAFNVDSLGQVIEKLTELEYIEIRGPLTISHPKWLTLFEALPKLRYFLLFNDFFVVDDSKYHNFFQVCPSLRAVIHGIQQDSSISTPINTGTIHQIDPPHVSVKYFKDIFTNSIKNVSWSKNPTYEGIPEKYFKF